MGFWFLQSIINNVNNLCLEKAALYQCKHNKTLLPDSGGLDILRSYFTWVYFFDVTDTVDFLQGFFLTDIRFAAVSFHMVHSYRYSTGFDG